MAALIRRLSLAVALLAPTGFAHAQEMDVVPSIQVPILVKVMSYDRQLRARAPQEIVVAIAYQSGNRVSSLGKDDVVREILAMHESDGVRLRTVLVDLDHVRLADALRECTPTLLYVTPLRATDIGAVAGIARDARVTSMTGVPRYVSLGLSVGVAQRGGRPKILINLEASRLEGADFGAELLKLAEIVK